MNARQRKRVAELQESLKAQAMQERARRYYPMPSDYCDAIEVLREEKGKTWDEVRDFFLEQGMDFSVQGLIAAYKRWKTRK